MILPSGSSSTLDHITTDQLGAFNFTRAEIILHICWLLSISMNCQNVIGPHFFNCGIRDTQVSGVTEGYVIGPHFFI